MKRSFVIEKDWITKAGLRAVCAVVHNSHRCGYVAVEKDKNPTIYYGFLISDDGFNFVMNGVHDGDGTHFKERVLPKHQFNFTKISKDDISVQVLPAIARMKREAEDDKLEYEASVYKADYATSKFKELIGNP